MTRDSVFSLLFAMTRALFFSASQRLSEEKYSRSARAFTTLLVAWCLVHSWNALPFYDHFWGSAFLGNRWEADGSLYGHLFHLLRKPSLTGYAWVALLMQAISGVLFVLGKARVASSVVFLISTINLFSSLPTTLDGGNNFAHLLVYLLPGFALARSHFFKSILGSLFLLNLENSCIWLARTQLCLIYTYAGTCKLTGRFWQEGTALYYVLQNPDFGNEWTFALAHQASFLTVLATYATVVFQLSFPVLVWKETTRPFLFLGGIILHLGIAFGIGLFEFGLIMIVGYVAWAPERWFVPKVAPEKISNLTLALDETCSMCLKFGELLRNACKPGTLVLDRAWLPSHESLRSIPLGERTSKMVALSADGRSFRGFEAVVIALSLSRLRVAHCIALLLGRFGLGEPLYDMISGLRMACRSGTCSVQGQDTRT